MRMQWNSARSDRQGIWSWGIARDWGKQAWDSEIRPKLDHFATMTWNEIRGARVKSGPRGGKSRASHHEMQLDVICSEAQSRAAEIELIADILFRFRLGTAKRLWGYREREIFHLIWYDPTHQIYPVDPN